MRPNARASDKDSGDTNDHYSRVRVYSLVIFFWKDLGTRVVGVVLDLFLALELQPRQSPKPINPSKLESPKPQTL